MGAQLIERRPPRIPSVEPKGGEEERLALLSALLLVAVEVFQDGLAHEGSRRPGGRHRMNLERTRVCTGG
jgi:hypothetical protein